MGDINANVIYYSTFPKTVLSKTRLAMLEDESVKEVINILHESSDSFQWCSCTCWIRTKHIGSSSQCTKGQTPMLQDACQKQ